jgi:glucose-6-phosphate isomerase
VNTVPPETLSAFIDHGVVALTVEQGLDEAQAQIARLAQVGIDLHQAGEELQTEGVDKFIKPFDALLKSIEQKREMFASTEYPNYDAHLLTYQNPVDTALGEIERDNVIGRIWNGDHTVWRPQPEEISNRLGWLRVAEELQGQLTEIQAFVDEVRAAGYTQALLLGMGGSSLAPEVFRKTFGVANGYLDLAVLDSTDPGAVLNFDRQLDPAATLYIVSTKSGGTVETLSFFKYFFQRTVDIVGAERAGEHFIAITDPGSTLETLMQQHHVRKIFLNNPDIGGRYSALSHFGLVPAALLGVDLSRLLERAHAMMDGCAPTIPTKENPGAWLGAILGELAKAGRDKVTMVLPHTLASFGDWVEQLIAESTGKDGKGILPVVGEPLGSPEVYGSDRLFVYVHLEGDDTQAAALKTLEDAGHPVVTLNLKDPYDLGGQFFSWELAVAIAGYRMGIHPFDQPNVESAKVLARKMVAAYAESGTLPPQEVLLAEEGITVYGDVQANNLAAALSTFLTSAKPGDYIGIHAYVTPNAETDAQLAALRNRLRNLTKLATTVGYGPRFLHSTGQLHKGDAGNGLFIQLTSDAVEDAPIPDQPGKPESTMSFGILKLAQALGDAEALKQAGRRVLRLHLGTDVLGGLEHILKAMP